MMHDTISLMQSGSGFPPVRISILLVPGFSLLSLTSALETMRVANRVCGGKVFEWSLCSDDAAPVVSSLGMPIPVNSEPPEICRADVAIVCSGVDVEQNGSLKTLNWLRRAARQGALTGGLCTGAYLMAEAGILVGHKATIHWENQASFRERFFEVDLVNSPTVIDRTRFSTAGGTSSIDLILLLIRDRLGDAQRDNVAAHMLYTKIHTLQGNSGISPPDQLKINNVKLLKVIRAMEASIENPVEMRDLAALMNVSVRQLERSFRKEIGLSPNRYYSRMRIERAHQLIVQTELSITEIGVACGFSSNSAFSKKFREAFGITPHSVRRSAAPKGSCAAPTRHHREISLSHENMRL